MIGIIRRGKIHLTALGLGIGLLVLVACGSEAETPATAQQLADFVGILTSPAGSAAYEASVRSSTGAPAGANAGIWVSGQGEASASPDLATLNLGIAAFADTVAEARASAAEAMGRTLEALKSKGVAEWDFQTSYFNINARYTSREVTRWFSDGEAGEPEEKPAVLPLGVPTAPKVMEQVEVEGRAKTDSECVLGREQVVPGYQATNQLSVKVRDLDSLRGIIDQAIEAGGDLARFQSVGFSIEESGALKEQALAAAIQDLGSKAEQIAVLAGVELGRLSYITETGGMAPSPMVVMARAAFTLDAAPTPIMAGELDVRVSVQAAFEIQQPEV